MVPKHISTIRQGSNTGSDLPAVSIPSLYNVVKDAGDAILELYNDVSLWQETSKSDNTPVTAADIRSSEMLVASLPSIVNCPVVSEEALPSFQQRKDWLLYWLIDPMDGTREFIEKTDEFVINVALMRDHQPVFGMVYRPITKEAWWGGVGIGAFKGVPLDAIDLVATREKAKGSSETLIALGSRRSKWQGEWKNALTKVGFQVKTQSLGSALKFCYLADGSADLYPRMGLTSEWDTAAPQAILEQTGGAICQWDGAPLEYGKEDTLNPFFVAVADRSLLTHLVSGGN